ncbi:MAG: metallophosphoesterase family protein [Bacilli bacterium]
MKKFLILLLITFFGLGFSSINAAGKTAYNIITNPGENLANSVRINYHTDVLDTFVEFTTVSDTSFNNATRVSGTYENWSAPQGAAIIGFGDRYRVRVNLEDLSPDTKYMYRVGKEGDFSKNYYFSTAKEGDFTFLHITDPQYYNETTSQIFNNLMTQAFNKNPDITFTFFTGDIIDDGGDENQWNMFYNKSNINRQVIATIPGNHEYYDAMGSGSYFGEFYNINNNNPDNGARNHLNNTYYFRYNNALFIGLNTESKTQATLKPWFEEVVQKNNDADFIIVGMHRSMYGSIYASDSINVRYNWLEVFDRYGVDLVLSGHDHIYSRSHIAYNNKVSTDPIRGTTYIIGGSGGEKFYSAEENDLYAKVIERTSLANLITVTDKEIYIDVINLAGNTVDELKDSQGNPKPILTKRVGSSDPNFSRDSFKEAIVLEQTSAKPLTATLTWPKSAYKNVINMQVVQTDYDYVIKQAYMYHPDINSFTFTDISSNKLNIFKVVVTYSDLSKDELFYEIDTTVPEEKPRIRILEAFEIMKTEFDAIIRSIYSGD